MKVTIKKHLGTCGGRSEIVDSGFDAVYLEDREHPQGVRVAVVERKPGAHIIVPVEVSDAELAAIAKAVGERACDDKNAERVCRRHRTLVNMEDYESAG